MAKGCPKVPVILVQFPDLMFEGDPNSFFNRFCNGSDDASEDYYATIGSKGPVAQYFSQQSDGQFVPEFGIIGPVTLPRSYSYYGQDASNTVTDIHFTDFYRDALRLAIEGGADLDAYDNNRDGIIDFVFFIYAGEGQNAYGSLNECIEDGWPEKANLIWPKESAYRFTVWVNDGLDARSLTFGGVGCTNELYDESVDGIGTMCHELSHGLGLPDFYDQNYVAFGMDYWDLMDAGCYCQSGMCPSDYSAYERDALGWRSLEEMQPAEPLSLTLLPMERGGRGIKLVNPANPDEYYILENRQSLDFDTYLGWKWDEFRMLYGPNKGLMVTHVDYSANFWRNNEVNNVVDHQRITLLPADDELIPSAEILPDDYIPSILGDLYPGLKRVTSIPFSRFNLFTGGTLDAVVSDICQNDDLSLTLTLSSSECSGLQPITTEGSSSSVAAFYDLTGRRIEHPCKGLYIRSGRKVLLP